MKNTVWNVILTTLGTALLGLLGWTLLHVSSLEQAEARRGATEFTKVNAAELQRELTEIMTDIDMRLRLIERDIHWLKQTPYRFNSTDTTVRGDGWSSTPVPEPEPAPDPPVPPRYQLDIEK